MAMKRRAFDESRHTEGIGYIDLRVAICDEDVYALSALNGYLAWDRRTRVVFRADSPAMLRDYLNEQSALELPEVVLLGVREQTDAPTMKRRVARLKQRNAALHVLCLALRVAAPLVEAAAAAGADAFLLKQEVIQQIAWAVVHATRYDLVLSPAVAAACVHSHQTRMRNATILPERRLYPQLSARLRQALELSVVEGMPAHLVADEMGVSLHTVRSYIKEGYRILAEQDETVYPIDMTARERAFMRYTALVSP